MRAGHRARLAERASEPAVPRSTRLRDLWRGTGADLPGGDPLPSHRAPMEGYLWRFTDPGRGRVLLVACGVNHPPGPPWATVVVAAHPSGLIRSASVDGAWDDTAAYRISALPALALDGKRLRVRIGDDVDIRCVLRPEHTWPPRRLLPGTSVFSAVPGLNHYWHPHLFGARVEGAARLADEVWDLSGSQVYAEKSWGRGFPPAWWWGQAHGFDREDLCVAFAGGSLGRGGLTLRVNGLVVRAGDETIGLFPPAALVRATVRDGTWHLAGRSARHRVELTGTAPEGRVYYLPVPRLERHRFGSSVQHLAGRLHVTVRQDGRLRYAGESALASLETGGLAAG
ncbi:tocopherol cyclase family protein [Streptomyces albus]|uniref:tocopherol cyclase family protein n=1 Tax=Streptomyces albus TaxID=1888 RepID=UPI0007C729B8|nr:tocopherol cyclase family protein [Streptomyces albus]